MQFPANFKDEVIEQTDILSLVGEYVTLKRSGSEYKGLCPFHGEKTASFFVSPEKGVYHCHGCKAGGGVINFIMEAEGLLFPEALEFLARRAGMQIPDRIVGDNGYDRAKQEKLLAINKAAGYFYYQCLRSPQGQSAMGYLVDRGLSEPILQAFAVGYAPNQWGVLTEHMQGLGYTEEDLREAGLVAIGKESGKPYEIFRNRVIFPIINLKKEVIGFGGRIMDNGQPKYMNSPDTLVYNKSKNLFGLNLAKKTKGGMGILAEGYMDAIALHQAGFDGAVASSGTAFTQGQAHLMKRYFKTVVLCFDNDDAGRSATERAIPLLCEAGTPVRVMQLTEAKDPDEYIKNHGADAFRHVLGQSVHHVDYRFSAMKSKYNLLDSGDCVRFLEEAARYLSTMDNAVEREIYGGKVGEWLSVSKDSVLLEVKKELEKKARQARWKLEKSVQQAPAPIAPYLQMGESLYDVTRASRGEEGLLRVVFLEPTLLADLGNFTAEVFSVALLGRVFQLLKERYQQGLSVELPYLTEYLEKDEMNHLVGIFSQPQDKETLKEAMMDYLAVMKEEYEKRFFQGEDRLLVLQQQMMEQNTEN